ncbi:putative E3 ubiquitin-protein ligase UBR7 isoform X2 [Macaca nemestrina]|uniref:putative E3 ubiquitin-protein ligase UBR7 isoform X2 n=1 Tax=Macaca mulatta TaxID=9544 RepID=UPI0003ABC06D|nr:putative E3 ubiquitin-protein ligase UBR7 isoform X2 [Macaca mulatta]XP_015308703.1 putative E3 ubiquitin-protein ligase UBR7 isoform X3 [Macaca fascicularis]XP_050655090.1 putative E3 ubiquitin-protein ligase UBR7 isoform X2 [Macaca thibetana thibetana]
MAGAEGSAGRQSELEPVVSLVDVLEEDEELENEACAVLGGSDSEKCSYSQGSVKRQALYACSTCTPEGEEPAGICLACSYECHGSHKLFELYTKRNFRCDCGNSKFKTLECKLLPDKAKVNSGNKYNDNFFGLYCICKRPYPDPEDEIPDEMIQCVVCEDWFHGRHLGAIPPESGDFQEMVCQACMKRCSFLWAYAAQLAVTKISTEDDGLVRNIDGIGDQEVIKAENGEHQDSTLKEDVPEQGKDDVQEVKAEQNSEPCASSSSESDLQKMYGDLDVLFLTDEYDTVLAYENKGKIAQATDRSDPLMDTLSSMNRVQQVELICEYNDLKTELKDYLKRFADEGTVVKREDIQQFFEEFQSKKRRRVDGMQYYCS